MRRKEWLFLILILFIAAFLRFFQLGQVPPSPDWDEASLGYNAFSLLKTGRDEFGIRWPLFLRSFGDYKPAIYAYLVIPAIKFFGLNVFAVRLPAAILGTLAVLLTYFLVKELFSHFSDPGSEYAYDPGSFLGLTAAALLAISPWHLQFSRVAFESGVGLFFNILWVLLFLKALRRPWLLIPAALFAAANLYVYQAERVFTPLLVLALLLIWRQKLIKLPPKYLVLSFLVGVIVFSPFVYFSLTNPAIFQRAKGTGFAADLTPFLAKSVVRLARDWEKNDYLGLILDNRRLVYFFTLINGYLSHFDLNWLFISGDEVRHHAPGMGLLYLWELPFLLLGIYSLLFGKFPLKAKLLSFAWFLLAPVPAAFTTGVPHAVRTLRFLPIIQVFVALGLLRAWQMVQNKSLVFKFCILICTFSFAIFNFFYYFNQYFVQQNYFHSQSWQYGYQEAVGEVKKMENNYQKIVVSDEPHLDQSYIFFLFYLHYDPVAYQKSGTNQGFAQYVFRPINWPEEEKSQGFLYVGRPNDFGPDAEIIKTINFLNNEPAIVIAENP